jgi:hypothetical protein
MDFAKRVYALAVHHAKALEAGELFGTDDLHLTKTAGRPAYVGHIKDSEWSDLAKVARTELRAAGRRTQRLNKNLDEVLELVDDIPAIKNAAKHIPAPKDAHGWENARRTSRAGLP